MKTLRKNIILIILTAQFAVAAVASATGLVSPDELRRWQETKPGFYLLDVRSQQAYTRKHLPGAIHIPAFVVHKKGFPKGETFVLYDSGIGTTEGLDAAEKMSGAGYGKVFLLDGGLARWESAGLPIDAPLGVLSVKLVEAISVTELQHELRYGTAMTLVDLRDAAQFKVGSISGALNVPGAVTGEALAGWQKDALVVLFDSGTGEAEKQAETVRRAGFKLIRFLYGGYPEWKRQNVP